MNIRHIFVTIAAVTLTSAVFADSSSVTSKKYVDDFMTGYQDKLSGSGANTLMIYDNSDDGIGEKNIVSLLGNNTSATDVPNVGAVKAGMNGKQDTINGTAGYVMTGTGNAGSVGERAIYGTTTNYPDALVTAETVNTGVINAVNSSLRRVNANGEPDNNGTLWEIADTVLALSFLPAGYTQLEYIESTGTQYIDTGVTDVADSKFELDAQQTEILSGFPTLLGAHVATPTATYNVVFGYGSSNKFYTQVGTGGQGYTTFLSQDTNRHVFRLTTGATSDILFEIDGQSTSATYNLADAGLSLYLCARHREAGTGVASFTKQKVYSLKIWKSRNLIRNFIPCKNSSNVVGMYDTVTGQFFRDAAGGNFVAGPVVGN